MQETFAAAMEEIKTSARQYRQTEGEVVADDVTTDREQPPTFRTFLWSSPKERHLLPEGFTFHFGCSLEVVLRKWYLSAGMVGDSKLPPLNHLTIHEFSDKAARPAFSHTKRLIKHCRTAKNLSSSAEPTNDADCSEFFAVMCNWLRSMLEAGRDQDLDNDTTNGRRRKRLRQTCRVEELTVGAFYLKVKEMARRGLLEAPV